MSEKLVNQRFSRLIVVSVSTIKNGRKHYLCTCDCGKSTVVSVSRLINGKTKSCGCLRKDNATLRMTSHGQSKTLTHKRWKSMRSRCSNQNTDAYKNYGGRGITVCERWLDSFENFLLDMGECPGENWTVERKNTNGNYEPNNCRWATRKEQNRNTRRSILIEINGLNKSLGEWCEIQGLAYSKVYKRISKGWAIHEALEIKPMDSSK